uniref:Uncharacterized protein n=1 Tax=Podarcis muralis TaxID=64176 RepID=A0A670JTZ7_PODMU
MESPSPSKGQNEQLASFSRCLSLVSVGYTPRLTSKDLAGKITSSTFTLEQPRCVFNKFVTATDEIWLLVARSSGTLFNYKRQIPAPNPHSQTPFKTSSFIKLTVLRVGNEVDCKTDPARPDCNGPLPEPGPYSCPQQEALPGVVGLQLPSSLIICYTGWG